MRAATLALSLLASCTLDYGSAHHATPDAASSQQQPPQPPPPYCMAVPQWTVSCAGDTAMSKFEYIGNINPHSICPEPVVHSVHCAGGCYVPIFGSGYAGSPPADLLAEYNQPAIMCANTPEATAGAVCNANQACLPTRAHLNADGTVASQTYLTCTGTCVPTSAPTIAGYLQACDSQLIAPYAMPGTSGSLSGCLVAWDASTQSLKSGKTQGCYGDWMCPAGSLCDDQIKSLDGPAYSLCKPGPRGTLTVQMLSP